MLLPELIYWGGIPKGIGLPLVFPFSLWKYTSPLLYLILFHLSCSFGNEGKWHFLMGLHSGEISLREELHMMGLTCEARVTKMYLFLQVWPLSSLYHPNLHPHLPIHPISDSWPRNLCHWGYKLLSLQDYLGPRP